jgi:hypothetical protein
MAVSLKAGENSIRFTTLPGNGWAPDLDAVIVYDEQPLNTKPSGTLYAAADATLVGGLTLTDNTGSVTGSAVEGFGTTEDTRMCYEVTVDKAAPYQLNILYSNAAAQDQKMDLYINGEHSTVLLPSTMSTQLFKILNMTVYLDAGVNTIAIGCAGGDAVYECEVGGEYQSCNTKLNDGGAHMHSGGYCVGAGANNGACSFTMHGIEVPEDGRYTLQIFCGSGDTRTFRLKVNGQDTGKKYSVNTGHFHNFKATEIQVELKKGSNSLTIWQEPTSKGDTLWLPNFDYVTVEGIAPSVDVGSGGITIQKRYPSAFGSAYNKKREACRDAVPL